jgi:uncharacterized membrane protein YfcA
MTARERVRGLLAGLAAGIGGGLFGVGGGIVMIPLLTGGFRLTQHQAHGTSLAVMGATALVATAVYGAFARVEWATAAAVAIASVWTARYGARWATRTSPLGLKRAFAVFIALVAVRLLWSPPLVAEHPLLTGFPGIAFALVLGCAVGIVSGYMGVGGGIVAVPAFTLVLGMSQQVAQGTSLAIIIVTGPAGAMEHSRHGNVVWALVPTLAIGAAVGAPLASWIAQMVPHEALVRTFALFLLANAVSTWVRASRPTGSAVNARDR